MPIIEMCYQQCRSKGYKDQAHQRQRVEQEEEVVRLTDTFEHVMMIGPKQSDDCKTGDIPEIGDPAVKQSL